LLYINSKSLGLCIITEPRELEGQSNKFPVPINSNSISSFYLNTPRLPYSAPPLVQVTK